MTLPDLDPLVCFDERLRQVPIDGAALAAALADGRKALAVARPVERFRLLTYCGNAARVLGRSDEAIELLTDALELARGGRRIGARIRLGEAYRCADRPEAVEVLEQALAEARAADHQVDFALQHLGKALLDRGDTERASGYLEEALTLRRSGADTQLIASTERALALARTAI